MRFLPSGANLLFGKWIFPLKELIFFFFFFPLTQFLARNSCYSWFMTFYIAGQVCNDQLVIMPLSLILRIGRRYGSEIGHMLQPFEVIFTGANCF